MPISNILFLICKTTFSKITFLLPFLFRVTKPFSFVFGSAKDLNNTGESWSESHQVFNALSLKSNHTLTKTFQGIHFSDYRKPRTKNQLQELQSFSK